MPKVVPSRLTCATFIIERYPSKNFPWHWQSPTAIATHWSVILSLKQSLGPPSAKESQDVEPRLSQAVEPWGRHIFSTRSPGTSREPVPDVQ